MDLGLTLVEIWRQVLVEDRSEVQLEAGTYPVNHTRSQRLRFIQFMYAGQQIEAIEQNPEKASRWAQLAREGKRIIQFRVNRRYIGNVCEGTLLRYPGWKSAGLPD